MAGHTDHMTPEPSEMGQRQVACRIEAAVTQESDVVIAVAVAAEYERLDEHLSVTIDGVGLPVRELLTEHTGRLHLVDHIPRGYLVVDYSASVDGCVDTPMATELESVRCVRPSRYCQSDELAPTARTEFDGLTGRDLLRAVSSWVGSNLAYVPGSSRPTDGAVATLLARQGVCRDYAHLCAALLRANDLPARLVSVYAPGLDPMDFHAVTEVCIDGVWLVVDATCLAPRSSMVRIATGADATDTAFLTTRRGGLDLTYLDVTAITTGLLPFDDVDELVSIR